MKIWTLTLWKVSGVNDTLGQFLLQSLSTKDLWERESLRLVSRDPNLVHATHNINVFFFVLHISLSARLCLAHTAYFNWSLWTSHRTLLASLSSNFNFGNSKKGRGNSSLNNWLIFRLGRTNLRKEDDTVFRDTSQLDSKNVANKLLHGGSIISFMKLIIILIFTMTNLSACIDVIMKFSRTHWGKKLKISSFLYFIP